MTAQYAEGFAHAYDEHWHLYPTRAAGELLRLHRALAPDAERRVLDVGCGTGLVGERLAAAGYAITGLDVSPAMLARARARLGEKAVLLHGDAADFALAETFPFAISTYDIPNHLGGMERVGAYLRCVFRAVAPGGLFAFDVATPKGLAGINAIQVRENDTSILLYRGALNEDAGYGFYRISGVMRAADGRYDRFQTTITNWVVPLDELLATMREVGWRDSYLAAPADLTRPLDLTGRSASEATKDLSRVYVIARR